MKILAVMGSPRKEGNTYLATKQIEEKIKRLDPAVEFEYLFLRDADIQMCLGCRACFNKGEASCPCKDDIPGIAAKMLEADGVILASPTYVGNMTGYMKNFLDRLAYFCHRPAFHEKKALIVTTTGSSGARAALIMMSIPLGSMGFQITGKIGVVMNTGDIRPIPSSYNLKIDQTATVFFNKIRNQKHNSPTIFGLVSFYYNHERYRRDIDSSYDAKYWKAQGWLEPGKEYFTDTKVNMFQKLTAWIIMKFMRAT